MSADVIDPVRVLTRLEMARQYCSPCTLTPRECAAIADELAAQQARCAKLLTAITSHHGQRADDRCWADDDALYAAAGLPQHDSSVGDKGAMLENCIRFVRHRCDEGGAWKSYTELETENADLRAEIEALRADSPHD